MAADILSDLLFHYSLDETSGVTANDGGALGNDGTLTGTTFTAATVPGHIETAIEHSLTGQYIEGPVVPSTNDQTLSFWFKSNGAPAGNVHPLTTRQASSGDLGIIINSSSVIRLSNGTTTLTLTFDLTAYMDDEWHLIMYTLEGTRVMLFVDDMATAKTDETVSLGTLQGTFNARLFERNGAGHVAVVSMDDTRWYSGRALNQESRQALFDYGQVSGLVPPSRFSRGLGMGVGS